MVETSPLWTAHDRGVVYKPSALSPGQDGDASELARHRTGPQLPRRKERPLNSRAFANRPKILFADEPTGNLDRETGSAIVAMLEELNRDARTTLVLVTHDPALAERAHRVISLSGGTIASDRPGTAIRGNGAHG